MLFGLQQKAHWSDCIIDSIVELAIEALKNDLHFIALFVRYLYRVVSCVSVLYWFHLILYVSDLFVKICVECLANIGQSFVMLSNVGSLQKPTCLDVPSSQQVDC